KNYFGTEAGIIGGTAVNAVIYAVSGSGIKFYANAALKWGINSSGDFTFGSSSHICDSAGTPTLGSGFGTGATIVGTDYAFLITCGTTGGGTGNGGNVTFGHTFSAAPIVTLAWDPQTDGTARPLINTLSTTILNIIPHGANEFVTGAR